MFDAYTKSQLVALCAGRIAAHQGWVARAAKGDPARFRFVLDQSASASAEVTTIVRIIGCYDELNELLTHIGIGPLPDLSPAERAADQQAAEALGQSVRTKAWLTTHLN